MSDEIIRIQSRLSDLQIALLHKYPKIISKEEPILFIHGSSFSAGLSFGFRMNNYSWMDHLKDKGYDVYALDFLGYGNSDLYPEMNTGVFNGIACGRAADICGDIDNAVDFIIKNTGKRKVNLIAHSWGGSVAALYTSKNNRKINKLVLFAAITCKNSSTPYLTIEKPYEALTPHQRIEAMRSLTPDNQVCQLGDEIFETWGPLWLQSNGGNKEVSIGFVRFPAGPLQDVEDLLHNRTYYNPEALEVPVLIIRGEWDGYPNNADAHALLLALSNAPYKKYVVIEKGTHVMHLEKCRFKLYDEVFGFLERDEL
ncbi:alpha/beta hydrolase [Chitinophagaceae bacterium LWZ2-11]